MKKNAVFDRHRPPMRQHPLLMPLLWIVSFFALLARRAKFHRIGMAGIKPPYLIISKHQSFFDNYVVSRAVIPHRANYISDIEGIMGMEMLCRNIGCLGKRKFINDTALVKNIIRVVQNKDIIMMFPEARYSNVGTAGVLPASVGKLAKLLRVPLVLLTIKGNYLYSPIWNLKRRRVRVEAEMKLLLTAEQLAEMDADAVNTTIQNNFTHDEYKWQRENKVPVSMKTRAEGLHLVLYKCPACGMEHHMGSKWDGLFCSACGKQWTMDQYGVLHALTGETEFPHIPDWYEYQRETVKELIDKGAYRLEANARVMALPGTGGFVPMGNGYLRHDTTGFHLEFTEAGAKKVLEFPPSSMLSVHTEYNYKGNGMCISLSVPDNTYFLFPDAPTFNVTKVQFATEELYRRA